MKRRRSRPRSELIEAREEHSAWERLRQLHPADMGIIVVGLPRVSRDTMLRVMSPETVAWMLRQMDPIEAGRVGTRLGARVLTPVLGQLHPQHAPPAADAHRARACRDAPAPIRGGDRAARAPAGYGGLACGRSLPVRGDRWWRSAVAPSLRVPACALDEDRRLFTLVFVVDGAHLAGQIAMVDLALAEPDTSVRALTTQVVATVTVDARAGGRARGVPARGRGTRRDRRHADADPYCPRDCARGSSWASPRDGCWFGRRCSGWCMEWGWVCSWR